MMQFWLVRLAQVLGRALPDHLSARLAALVATIAYWALPQKRRNMQHNLRVMLGIDQTRATPGAERHVRKLARRSMVAYVGSVVDFFRLPRLLPRVLRDTVLTDGWEHIDRLLADGRGAVFATAHFGHWDLAGAALASHCPPGRVYAVAEPFTNVRLDAMVTAERAGYGLQAVPMTDVRRMLKVLREGNVLGLLVDRPVGDDDGVEVRFFGQVTRIPAGAATLAMLARCPILPGFLHRDSDGRFRGKILPPIEPVRTGDRAADVQATMQRVVDQLEQVIRSSPHQWYMFRAMWPMPGGGDAPGSRSFVARGLGMVLAALRRIV